ncbi:hypothetical protein PoB_004983800 [Plakobranchus ocellatus]|uniref:DM2 domain-containing protein n=1 Tax=Plakobranchus ocellatus TaxID=259542 RepID=A0AAV4BUR5_9GAST|nr:hypothetical protein PoB_004983800 [Plakobranchus ocellatus]
MYNYGRLSVCKDTDMDAALLTIADTLTVSVQEIRIQFFFPEAVAAVARLQLAPSLPRAASARRAQLTRLYRGPPAGTMERIKNLISPRARRKKLELGGGGGGAGGDSARTGGGRTFGVALEQLMARLSPESFSGGGVQSVPRVPFVVRRICEYIYKYGKGNR